MSFAPRPLVTVPGARRFQERGGRRLLWVCAVGVLVFGVAELPALARMSSHGTSVLGFELAGSTQRLREILGRWGATGHGAAGEHVLIDLGFIVCYGALLFGACSRLASGFGESTQPKAAAMAVVMAWAGLTAAVINLAQKILLWLELHGHIAQPLPGLAAVCGVLTIALGLSAALFALGGALALRRSPTAIADGGAR
jgi:hypothetical protein